MQHRRYSKNQTNLKNCQTFPLKSIYDINKILDYVHENVIDAE